MLKLTHHHAIRQFLTAVKLKLAQAVQLSFNFNTSMFSSLAVKTIVLTVVLSVTVKIFLKKNRSLPQVKNYFCIALTDVEIKN